MTREALAGAWDRLWFRPAGPRALIGARVVLSLHALWIWLSRPDMPELVAWPGGFWRFVTPLQPWRFGIGLLPLIWERALYLALPVLLVAAAAGWRPRWSCGLAGMLLYHFAPFEEVLVGMPHTFFGGLTVPVLGLLVLAFAEAPAGRAEPSPEYRWPVALVRLLFSFNYFFAGVAKLRFSGPAWSTAGNIANWAIENWSFSGAPWGLAVAASPTACWAIGLGTFLVEFLFPLAAFSGRAAAILVPLALVGHVGIVKTLGIFFPSVPLLLLYVDWDRFSRFTRAEGPEPSGRTRGRAESP